MIVGITGSRSGPTEAQAHSLTGALRDLRSRWDATALHHGDCVGVDDLAARVAHEFGYRVIAHPPVKAEFRAWGYADFTHRKEGYLARDRAIVDACDVLIGCPLTDVEQERSGTWYTIRYARSVGHCKLLVIGPLGTIIEQRGFTLEQAPR